MSFAATKMLYDRLGELGGQVSETTLRQSLNQSERANKVRFARGVWPHQDVE
jgi:hypothetical protein